MLGEAHGIISEDYWSRAKTRDCEADMDYGIRTAAETDEDTRFVDDESL